jgi:hypothetical protein
MVRHIEGMLADSGAATLGFPEGAITLAGARVIPDTDGAVLAPANEGAPITVVVRLAVSADEPATTRTHQAQSGALRPLKQGEEARALNASPLLILDLHDVTTIVTDARGPDTRVEHRAYTGLTPDGFNAAPIFALSARDLINRAAGAPQLTADAAALRDRIERLRREIDSKIHERAAYSVACVVMVLLGGVMALRLKDAMILPVYLWSFLPALAAVISISAGQGIAHEQGLIGFIILWGGVTVLAIITVTQYLTLRRH